MERREVDRPHGPIAPPENVKELVRDRKIEIQPMGAPGSSYTLEVGECITFVEHDYDSSVHPVKYYDIYHSGKIESLDTNYIRYLENGTRSFIGISYRGLDSQKKATDWSTIKKVACPSAGGKRRRRTRQARRRKNRRTHSRK